MNNKNKQPLFRRCWCSSPTAIYILLLVAGEEHLLQRCFFASLEIPARAKDSKQPPFLPVADLDISVNNFSDIIFENY